MKKVLIAVMIAFFSAFSSKAASITDPGLVTMIKLYELQSKKALIAQKAAMMAITAGHIWTKDEIEGVYNLQKEYNAYLDRFNGLLVYAAQGYGFYHEIGKLTENFGKLSKQLKASPMNAVAVALTPKRNKIYRELILTSADIVNDIRQVCLADIKMTEKQRMEIVFGIRPKLKKINKKLMHLALAVKYTSLNDVWLEIDNRARPPVEKSRIANAAFRRWRQHGRFIIKPDGSVIVRPPFPWIKPDFPDRPIVGPILPPNRPPLQVDTTIQLPIDPIKPIEPVDTLRPINPDKPLEPIDPIRPIEPSDTLELIKPVFPDRPIIGPIKPLEPIDPEPEKPVIPDKPVINPTRPTLPDGQIKPTRPLPGGAIDQLKPMDPTIKDPLFKSRNRRKTATKTKSTKSNFNTIR